MINKTIIRKSGKYLCQSVLISHTSANAKLSTVFANATLRSAVAKFSLAVALRVAHALLPKRCYPKDTDFIHVVG